MHTCKFVININFYFFVDTFKFKNNDFEFPIIRYIKFTFMYINCTITELFELFDIITQKVITYHRKSFIKNDNEKSRPKRNYIFIK